MPDEKLAATRDAFIAQVHKAIDSATDNSYAALNNGMKPELAANYYHRAHQAMLNAVVAANMAILDELVQIRKVLDAKSVVDQADSSGERS